MSLTCCQIVSLRVGAAKGAAGAGGAAGAAAGGGVYAGSAAGGGDANGGAGAAGAGTHHPPLSPLC